MLRRKALLGAAVLSLAVIADQITKECVRGSLALGESLHVFGPVHLTHVQNTGAVFGLGQGYTIIPTVASIVVLITIPFILRHMVVHHNYKPTNFETFSISLIAGGAIGNLIDRILFSAVTDFIDVEILPGVRWPAFNVADACIVVGTILVLIILFRRSASEGGRMESLSDDPS